MKLNKTKNATRNVFFGTLMKLYEILVPFIFRTVMVQTIGVQYLGLNSLFISVLRVLNLAELGVGSAMVFSMYRPIAENDVERVNALMRLYRLYYRVIGLVICVVGLAITPFIPKLIHGKVPADMNVYILYLMNLSVTVLSYWLFAYKNSILHAYQRTDLISKVALGAFTFKYVMQFIALVYFRNYYLYVAFRIVSQILNNIVTAVISHKYYPQYSPKGELPKSEVRQINGRIRDLFTAKLGGTIIHSADTIVISAFLGLTMLAQFQNYYYILSSIMAFVTILNTSVVAGIGNSLITKDRSENYREFKAFAFLQYWIIGFCICCFLVLFQPFMRLWMGEKLMLPYPFVILMCLVFAGERLVMMMSVYKDAGGIWHEDRFRPLVSGVCNLVINVIMVQFFGIYGIVLSTVISYFLISIPWIIKNVFGLIFTDESRTAFVADLLRWAALITFTAALNWWVCRFVPLRGVPEIAVKLLISIIIPNTLFVLLFRKKEEFRILRDLAARMIRRRI